MTRPLLGALCAAALTATLAFAEPAEAFCGFYVSGADAKLFNDATLVVLMRDGTRTVLSMQNAYQGPPENFAMVVPVPVVLQEENVKTLSNELFKRVDQLAAPRLVEYWEQDPCNVVKRREAPGGARPAAPAAESKSSADRSGVTIEAQFVVGEYEVVILSAKDSGGLDQWLRDNKYSIPAGSEPVLRPYVEAGMKFFVAKVDVSKVKFEKRDGRELAMLSPLRFHYDSDVFELPVRLGLLNSSGKQDLLIHILAEGKRYQVANYPNVTIPTNITLDEAAKKNFGSFYTDLFDATLEKNPKAVVTEYSWDAATCDPCPSPPLNQSELASLGGDALAGSAEAPRVAQLTIGAVEGEPEAARSAAMLRGQLSACLTRALEKDNTVSGKVSLNVKTDKSGDVTESSIGGAAIPKPLASCLKGVVDASRFVGASERKFTLPITLGSIAQQRHRSFVLTRLHARYSKDALGDDLRFVEAPPIAGGREHFIDSDRKQLEVGAIKGQGMNNFQGRYAIRHPWTGEIKCKEPRRGIWGGPPKGGQPTAEPALDLAFAPRGQTKLASLVAHDVPEIGLVADKRGLADSATKTPEPKDDSQADSDRSQTNTPGSGGCSCRIGEPATQSGGGLVMLGLLAMFGRWRKRGR